MSSVDLLSQVFAEDGFFDLAARKRVEKVQNSIHARSGFHGFDKHVVGHARPQLLDARLALSTWTVTIGAALCNTGHVLHGGAAASLLDYLTTMALVVLASPGFLDATTVSRTLTLTYLRPVPEGTTVTVQCEVLAAGKNTASIAGKILIGNKLCVTCIHDKVVLSSKSASRL